MSWRLERLGRWILPVFAGLAMLGLAVYLVVDASSRSIWHDEAWVAMSVLEPTIGQMLTYPDITQSTPPLYLLAVRSLVAVAGDSELVLRLVSIGCGLATLGLLILFTWKDYRSRAGTLITTLTFLGTLYATRYMSELRPFPAEALASLSLLLYFRKTCSRPWSGTLLVADTVILTLAYLLSNMAFLVALPLTFGNAAVGLLQARSQRRRREGWHPALRPALRHAIAFALGLGLMLLYYLVYWSGHSDSAFMQWFWKESFPASLQPTTLAAFTWTESVRFFQFFFFRGYIWAVLVYLSALLALVILRRYALAFVLVAVPAQVWLMSLPHVFPYAPGSRLFSFYLPIVFVAFAALLSRQFLFVVRRRFRHGPRLLLAAGVVLMLLHVRHQRKGLDYVYDYEPMKQFHTHLAREYKPGDRILLYDTSLFAFQYYNRRRGLKFTSLWLDNPYESRADVAPRAVEFARQNRGRRVWVIVTRPFPSVKQMMWEDQIIEAQLKKHCRILNRHSPQKGKIKNGTMLELQC